MATEAEIIQEPISVVKTEEESSKHLTLDPSHKAVEFLPGDSKKSEGGFTVPDETAECLDKVENMEVASTNGVETMNTVSQGNPEISKGESFLKAPEISKVSDETRGMSEHSKVDDTPFKAEKIPDDKEKLANVEVNAEGTKIDQNADIESDKQEANLDLKEQASIDTPDPIIDSSKEANEVVTESSKSNLVQEELEEKTLPALMGNEEGKEAVNPIETSGSETDQIVSDGIGYTLTSTVAETSEIKDHETASEISEVAKEELRNENPREEVAHVHEPSTEVDEKLEDVPSIIIKDTSQATIESSKCDISKDYANSESEKVVQAKDKEVALTETSDDVKKDEESTVPTPQGSIRELENIDVAQQQGQEGKPENEEIPKESFEQQDELEKEKPAGPLNEVFEDVNTAISSETSETSTSIKESKEKDLQVEVNENPETVEVDVSHVTDVQPEEQVHEAIGASEEKQEHREEVSESYQSRDSMNSEHIFTEAAASTTDLKSETSEMDKENIEDTLKQEETKEACEGSKSIIKEEQAIIEESLKSTEEEGNKSFQEDEKEVFEEPETEASVTGKENPAMEEHPIADISNSSISDETVQEIIKEDESIPLKLTEKSKEEIILAEDKEDLVHSSSFELEESKKDTKEKTLVEGSIDTADLESASAAVSLATTGQEGIGVDSAADIDVKPAESSISGEEDGTQDKVPNDENEDQMEKITREIPLKEITDENSGKDQAPNEQSETPVPKAKDNQSGQDEQSLDLGMEKEKIEIGKPLDEATDSGETSFTSNGVEKAIQEEQNLAKNLAKAEPDSEPVVEGQSKETFPKPSTSQADETITVVQNQESEKPIKEKLEDKPVDEDYIDSEENPNEVTKAVILSEEVNKEVEKADDSEDIKEHVVKEESSTNELHPESKGDETTNDVVLMEDYSMVSTECPKEGDSKEEKVEAKSSEVEEHSTKDSEASLVVEESEGDHGTGATSEETEHEKTKEEVPTKQDVVTGDGITGEQTLAANEPEEGAASSALLSKEQDEETISTINKIDEEKINEAEVSEDFSDAKQTAEKSFKKEEFQEVEDGKKDETAAAQTIEEPKEQCSTPALPSENIEQETMANKEEEEEKLKEIPQVSETVVDQETTVVAQASITEESPEIETVGTVEKLEELERKEPEKREDEPNELHAVPEEEIFSGQTSSDEQLHSLTSAVTSEELEHETKKAEDEKSKVEILEDASDARKTDEICSQKGTSIELEAVVEDQTTAGDTLTEKKSEEQVQYPTCALPSKEAECLQVDNREDVSLQKEQLQEDEALALAKDEDASSQTLPTEKSDEQIPNPVVALPSDEHKHEIVDQVDKTEEEKAKEEKLQNEESDGAKIVEGVSTEKDETRVAEAVLEGETNGSQIIAEESQEYGTAREEKIKAETMEDDKSPLQSERVLPGEKPEDQLHIATSTLPSEKHETKETKVEEQIREVEEASNFKVETLEKGFDNALLTEPEYSAIKDKILKEEVLKDKEVTEASYSTSNSEEPTKDGKEEDEPKDKLIEGEALKTNQNEELVVEAQKSSEDVIIDKQIVCEDKSVEDQGQASVAKIETATVIEEESSLDLSQADSEGIKDHVESKEIIDDIQKPEETTNVASDNQISRELDPIENPEITSSIPKEHVPIDLQERVAESLQQAEEVEDVKQIYPNEAEVGHGGDKVTENSGEEKTEEPTSVEDSTKVSSSDHIESSTKDSLQVTEDKIKEAEAKDEKGTTQILPLEKPEEQPPAPSSESPAEEGEHGVTSKVDAVSEKELKEVETLDKDSSDIKKGSQICLESEEKKELKAVVEQETIAVQAPPTEIKEDQVPHFEDGSKEDELKDEHTGDKTNETLKIPTTYEIQNERISVETLKDGANNNVAKEIVTEDKTITGEADQVESRATSSIGKEDFPTEKQDRALETTEKPEAGDLEPGKAREISPEAGVDLGEEKTDKSGLEITKETASADSGNVSLSALLERSTGEKLQLAERVIEERELTVSKEEPHVENAGTIQAKEAKTEEGEEGDEHSKTDSSSDAPVMVEAPRDIDTKPHKKSQNILSGVGSKVKHSISKVRKAITGKSSHSKEPKAISPKGSEK